MKPCETLTEQEKAIIQFVAENACSNKVAAEHFGMKEQSIKNRLRRIFDKTGVSTRLELVTYYYNKEVRKL
jgi:DNA-binding NarL/FixJ family response regulator